MLLQENQCLLLFSGAGQGVRTSALIIQMLTLLSETEPERERGRGCGETADGVVYRRFIKPLCSHGRVTSECGSVSQPGFTPAERKNPAHVDTAR